MSTTIDELQAQVLELPAEDRAQLLELLIASFEPRSEVQEAWLKVALKRRDDVSAGRVKMVPGNEALARVRSRIA
jgi:putative addiction module component (TIGR02574 family)